MNKKHFGIINCAQWHRSVVKSEGSGSVRSSHHHQPTEIRFRFRRRKWAILSFLARFRFRPKMNFYFHFTFRFRSKMSFAFGPKMLCFNWTVIFCDIGKGDFRFRFRFSSENGISFSSAFSFTPKNEKCIFDRPLNQTVSDYTLLNDFQTLNKHGFGQRHDQFWRP